MSINLTESFSSSANLLQSFGAWLTTIRYLAIDHHLAELIQRIFTPDISFRKSNIIRARECYEVFLKQLDAYDILGASDCKLLEAYSEDKANFSTANTRDAEARRDAKIARFRSEKELKRKLEVSYAPFPSSLFAFSYFTHESRYSSIFNLVSSTKPQTGRERRTRGSRSTLDQFNFHGVPDIPSTR